MPDPVRFTNDSPTRPLRTAALLAVGSEILVGETRDTNSSELAQSLSRYGVEVLRIVALPDRLAAVVAELRAALEDADLILSTGGLGPTPDDLTREAIAAVAGEQPQVNPELERWLRHLFERRGLPFAEMNLKQAWLIPSATAVPNERGTAPGWWVDRPDGRVIVAMPGPPSEMRAMWTGAVLTRLLERGLGHEQVVRTLRLAGIGESAVAARLGERLLRAENPVVATYARQDAVDVRIAARPSGDRTAVELADEAEASVMAAVGEYVWGRDDDTWPVVLGRELTARGLTLALVEQGTGAATMRFLGDAPWLLSFAVQPDDRDEPIDRLADEARHSAGASVGLAVRARESGEDTRVEVGVAGPWGLHKSRQTAFLGGVEGRRRAGLTAVAFLRTVLVRESDVPPAVSASSESTVRGQPS